MLSPRTGIVLCALFMLTCEVRKVVWPYIYNLLCDLFKHICGTSHSFAMNLYFTV